MRETCTSGSVRGGGGNVPAYSAARSLDLVLQNGRIVAGVSIAQEHRRSPL